MKTKFVVVGIFIGIVVGVIISFIFPELLMGGLRFNILFNKGLGYPADFYSPKSGSIFNILTTFPLFLSLVGGVIGFVLYKITRNIST